MSTTRSTLSHSTTFYVTKFETGDKKKKINIYDQNFPDSKLFFVKSYNKPRNLSKSFEIRYPFEQEKVTSNFEIFNIPVNISLKSILRNSYGKHSHTPDKFNTNNDNDKLTNKKLVKFADEVSIVVEEDEKNYHKKSNQSNKSSNNNIISRDNKDIKGDNNDDLQNIKKEENNHNCNNNLAEKLEDINQEINDNKPKNNKLLLNKFIENENKKYDENYQQESQILKSNVKHKKAPLAEVITVPSYRNYNIYRTNSKDLLKREREDNSKAQCKCCVIF